MSIEVKKVVTYVVEDKQFKTEQEAIFYKGICEVASVLEEKSEYNDFYINKEWKDVLGFMVSCGLAVTTSADYFDQ